MKKFFLSTSIAALLLVMNVAFAYAAPHRLVYGYFLNHDGYGTYGLARFYMDDAKSVEFLSEGDGVMGVFCGAAAYGEMYLCEYVYSDTEGPIPTGLYSYNLTTLKKTLIGEYSDEQSNPQLKFIDMTYDYSSETMYAIGFEMGLTSLYSFDLTTGKPTKIIDLDQNVATLASNIEGKLYGLDQAGVLYAIDKQTGTCAEIFQTGYSGMLTRNSFEFDHTTGELYWASAVVSPANRENMTYLVKFHIDGENTTMEDVAQIGNNATLLALYIPFVKAGENAPEAPANVKVTPDANGAGTATISWINPEETFGGKELQGLKSITIKRGDELVKTVTTTEIGKEMSFQETNIPAGYYRYTVYATNEAGDGEEVYVYAYIGHDAPAAPSNIVLTPNEGCATGTLTWEKPTTGSHDGYFTEEGLTYRIVRFPDKTEVAKGLTETTFTDDNIRRLGNYSYAVYACNQYGESFDKSNGFVLGAAIEVTTDQAFVEDFSSQEYFENRWMAIDANEDMYSWTFNTQAPSYQFGSAAMGAEYFINPGLPNDGNDADEWLITPPLNFKAGQEYVVVMKARVVKKENITITTGATNTVADQKNVKSLELTYNMPDVLPEEGVPFTEYKVLLPKADADYTACVGLHITTPYPADGFAFFHMTSFTVRIATDLDMAVENVESDNSEASKRIYNITGQYVGTSLEGLNQGVYIRNGEKILVK